MEEKKSKKKIVWRVISYVAVAVCASAITVGVCMLFPRRTAMSKLDVLEQYIDRCYIEDVDLTQIEDAAADAMVKAVGNRWSYYIPASEMQKHVDDQNNAYVGIGITISQREDKSGFTVTAVQPGSGAESAGILRGDILTGVEGQNVTGMETSALTDIVRGKENTTVSITVLRGEETHTYTVVRGNVLSVVATGQMLDNNIGLVQINNFNERCAQETLDAIKALTAQGAEALIFDVRYNPGGYKGELVKILDYLLPEGEIFHSVDYTGKEEIDRSDADCLDLPMAVLINGDTYSAAEYFAAALREYDRATLVGQPTTGKNHFQYTLPLGDGSGVNLSVGKYVTPKGVSLVDVGGLKPDIEIAVDGTADKDIHTGNIAPEEDVQIRAAIRALNGEK